MNSLFNFLLKYGSIILQIAIVLLKNIPRSRPREA
jgi:hypothetical protein